MSIILGSARLGENGHATGGKVGDQTGREVSTQSYYKHSKGWYVLRAKSANAANKIAKDMKNACSNKHIGYDQSNRDSLYIESKKYGFDTSKVKTNCETDCSALVRVCVNYAGIKVGDFNTDSERRTLLNTGKFEDVTSKVNTSNGSGLKTGDILVTKTKGHTVVVVSGGARSSSSSKKKEPSTKGGYSKKEKYKGKVNVKTTLNVRTEPNVNSKPCSFSPLKNGTIISVCDKCSNGWLYISYKGKYGFVSGEYIKKV